MVVDVDGQNFGVPTYARTSVIQKKRMVGTSVYPCRAKGQ